VLNKDRNWTILFVGGVSGAGKSSFASVLARFYGVKLLELDDLKAAMRAVTTKENLPMTHYWSTGVDWRDIGVDGNVNWLIGVSKEMMHPLRAVVERQLEDNIPIIIEGDFVHPELAPSFGNPQIKALFLQEPDREQLLRNFMDRESGEPQCYRADISIAYGKWQAEACRLLGIGMIDVRPWNTAVTRAIECLR